MSQSKDDDLPQKQGMLFQAWLASLDGPIGTTMRNVANQWGLDMSTFEGIAPDFVPYMGFEEEMYVPGHPDKDEPKGVGWSSFYTCICNGKRVYVWSFKVGSKDTACVMVSDHITDPGRGAGPAELQNMFAEQHKRQKARRIMRTHRLPCDPITIQSFIHEVTRGGNERMYLEGTR